MEEQFKISLIDDALKITNPDGTAFDFEHQKLIVFGVTATSPFTLSVSMQMTPHDLMLSLSNIHRLATDCRLPSFTKRKPEGME